MIVTFRNSTNEIKLYIEISVEFKKLSALNDTQHFFLIILGLHIFCLKLFFGHLLIRFPIIYMVTFLHCVMWWNGYLEDILYYPEKYNILPYLKAYFLEIIKNERDFHE